MLGRIALGEIGDEVLVRAVSDMGVDMLVGVFDVESIVGGKERGLVSHYAEHRDKLIRGEVAFAEVGAEFSESIARSGEGGFGQDLLSAFDFLRFKKSDRINGVGMCASFANYILM